MNFISEIRDSVYSPRFYRELFDRTFGDAVAYYFKLAAVLALLTTILFSISAVPQLNRGLWQVESSVMTAFPDDLELRLENGRLEKNIEGPVSIPVPEGWDIETSSNEAAGGITALMVIDTDSPATLAAYEEKKATVLVTSEAIIAPDNGRGRVQILPFEEGMSFTLTEDVITGFFDAVRPWYVLVAPALVVLIFAAIMFFMFILLLPLTLLALLVLVLLRLMAKQVGRKATYAEAYRLTLHAVTLPLVTSFLLGFIWNGASGPALFSALTLIIVFFNFTDLLPEVPPTELPN